MKLFVSSFFWSPVTIVTLFSILQQGSNIRGHGRDNMVRVQVHILKQSIKLKVVH